LQPTGVTAANCSAQEEVAGDERTLLENPLSGRVAYLSAGDKERLGQATVLRKLPAPEPL